MKIITNSAISLDGRLNTSENKQLFMGSEHDLKFMSVLRNRVDALLIGGNTFRNWPIPSVPNPKHLNGEPLRTEPLWNVVVSRKMNFHLSERYLNDARIKPLFLTDAQDPPQDFPCPVVRAPGQIIPQWIVAQLEERGVKGLLIEAGGNVIHQFLDADLVDEMYVTLCPWVIGDNAASSVVSGAGFPHHHLKKLTLLDSRVIGSEIFLHYAVDKNFRGTAKRTDTPENA